jgi:hypothetical protein
MMVAMTAAIGVASVFVFIGVLSLSCRGRCRSLLAVRRGWPPI